MSLPKARSSSPRLLSHDKHRGAKSELAAVLWLMDIGYEVFRNVSAHGAVDVVAIARDGSMIKIDVKTATESKGRYYTNRDCKQPSDIRILWVARNGSVLGFDTWPMPEESAPYDEEDD